MKTIHASLAFVVLFPLLTPACEEEEAAAPVEITFDGESELFPGFEFSTGLQPDGSPVQASFTLSAKGATKLHASAAPSGDESSAVLTGLPGTSSVTIEGGFALVGQLKIDVDGLPSYDGPIPGIDNVEIPFVGSTAFDPFAIGASVPARADIPPSRLPGIPLPGGIPGQLVLEIVEGSFVEVGFSGTCAGIDGTQATYSGTIERGGTLVITPLIEIEVPIVGTKTFEIPTFTVDLALGSSDVNMTAEVSEFGAEPESGDRVEGSCEPTTENGAGGAGGGTAEGGTSSVGGSSGVGGGGAGGGPLTETVCLDQIITVGDLVLMQGDAEFDGNGPSVTTTVGVTAAPHEVTLLLCADMSETASNWSAGHRCVEIITPVENAGLVAEPSNFYAHYTDTDSAEDAVMLEADMIEGTPDLVKGLWCMGDTSGDDVCAALDGSCSKCDFLLGCFTIVKP